MLIPNWKANVIDCWTCHGMLSQSRLRDISIFPTTPIFAFQTLLISRSIRCRDNVLVVHRKPQYLGYIRGALCRVP